MFTSQLLTCRTCIQIRNRCIYTWRRARNHNSRSHARMLECCLQFLTCHWVRSLGRWRRLYSRYGFVHFIFLSLSFIPGEKAKDNKQNPPISTSKHHLQKRYNLQFIYFVSILKTYASNRNPMFLAILFSFWTTSGLGGILYSGKKSEKWQNLPKGRSKLLKL